MSLLERPTRERKPINYKESEISFEEKFEDYKDEEYRPDAVTTPTRLKKETKAYIKKVKYELPSFSEDEGEELSEYEKQRLKNIEENKRMMMQLGILGVNKEKQQDVRKIIKPKVKQQRIKKPVTPIVMKKSLRLQGKTPEGAVLTPTINDTPSVEVPAYKRRKVEELSMIDEEKNVDMLDKLRNSLNSSSASDASALDVEKLIEDMRRINLAALQTKVVYKRIQSLCVHPMENKLLVIAGSTEGSLGLWDVSTESATLHYEPHTRAVNCVTINSHDHNKILSTSHDGTLRQSDIQIEVSSLIYQTNEDERISHITWHCDRLIHNILVSHGNGNVGLIDARISSEKNLVKTFKCHDRSVRTVQLHPVQPHYFLTSSGTGQAKIFDLRLGDNNAVSTMDHQNSKGGYGLTSAFYSPNGKKVLTTCNDDRLRIFDVSDQDTPLEAHKIIHDNHTGRWLSVFKAKWHPSSSDMFFIGSMQYPKRVQVYSGRGELLREIKDDDLTTICPVLDIHPTQPVVAGGDSVGRVYVFTTPSLKDKFDL